MFKYSLTNTYLVKWEFLRDYGPNLRPGLDVKLNCEWDVNKKREMTARKCKLLRICRNPKKGFGLLTKI